MLSPDPSRGTSAAVPPADRARGNGGILTILQAIAADRTDLDLGNLTVGSINRALITGTGPYLAHCSLGRDSNAQSPHHPLLRAADLTARVISGELLDGLELILKAASAARCRPILLKGVATALQYYPAPHLRTMGDLDIWVSLECRAALETELRASGFVQKSHLPADFFATHHHEMPFWHPTRKTWVELHSAFFPPWSPHANRPPFTEPALAPHLEATTFRGQPAFQFSDELQLVYTVLRWAESLDVERGICRILDIILLLRASSETLNWDQVLTLIPERSGIAALRLMLDYLSRNDLAQIPSGLLPRLAAMDRTTNEVGQRVLRRLLDKHVVAGRPFGRLATKTNLGLIWSALLGARPAWQNMLSIPYRLVFPPGNPRRFQLSFLLGRLRSLLSRRAGTG